MKNVINESTVGADASVKAQRHEATRSSYANIFTRCNRVGIDPLN